MSDNDELIARAEAALVGVTGGPWEAALERGCHGVIAHVLPEGGANFVAMVGNDTATPEKEPSRFANARFIAEARNIVPALIAALKASEARGKELEADLARAVGAMTDVSDRAMKTYRARNGRDCTIEASDGEACEIVHSDAMFGLRAVLNGLKGGTQ